MCQAEPTRRELLARAGAATGALLLGACATPRLNASALPTVEVMPGLRIHPRATWGADLPPQATIPRDQVKFLLVHHTASTNSYTDPTFWIRTAYAVHTGKGWPDVAYHFFVARDGSVFEGRAGSIDGAVEASATGGNQGWAQLVCLIGDHRTVAPTEAAQQSLVTVLRWLTWRYRLDTDPAATCTYVSRGSNKFPAGTTVTTPVISGHRDATFTACPGDAAYGLLPTWRQRVAGTPEPVFPDDGPYRRAQRLDVYDLG